MTIKIMIKNNDGLVLEDCGRCITDNTVRAMEMYEPELDIWLEKGEQAYLTFITVSS